MLIFTIDLCSEEKIGFECPEGYNNQSYLKKLSFDGLKKRNIAENVEVEERLNYELEVIHMNGVDEFFLIMWDVICFAKAEGIHVGPGRGALPASLVSYCLGVTQVDPIKYDLLFERYLIPGKNESIEEWVDFDQTRQEEILNYIKGKYCKKESSFEVCDRNDWADFQYIPELTLISEVLESIKKKYSMEIDINNIDFSDKNIYEFIGQGSIKDAFFLDAEGCLFISNMKPRSWDELLAGMMLSPGWTREELCNVYINARKANKETNLCCKKWREITESTYGLLLWQEQTMKLFETIGGFSPEQSDEARRALSKKMTYKVCEYERKFIYGCEEDNIAGCIALGVSEEDGKAIYAMMKKWTKYTMTKSHVIAMAMIVYQTMWLKYYYPAEYKDAHKDVCYEFLNISD